MRSSRWSTLAVLALAQFMVVLDVTIVNVALPDIQADLGFSADGAAVGGQRVHAAVRRLPAARRPGRRPARSSPDVHVRPGAVHGRLARGRARALAGRPDRRARGPGPGRRAALPRGALDPDRDLRPRARPQPRHGHLGRSRRPGRHARRRRRRRARRRDRLAVASSSSTCRSASHSSRSRRCSSARAAPASTARVASTRPARCSAPRGLLDARARRDPGRAAGLGRGRGRRAARRRRRPASPPSSSSNRARPPRWCRCACSARAACRPRASAWR